MAEDRRIRTQLAEIPAKRIDNSDEITIDLVDLFYRLLGNWKLIMALALVGAILAGVITIFMITPIYQSTSTIYVLSRKDSAINMSDLQIGTALTNDYIKVFGMWEVHEEVISNLGLDFSYDQMEHMLTVSNPSNTRMLDISVRSPDPELCAKVANEYARVASQYIADTMATDKPSIMSVALVPANPISPSKTRNVMIGFLLGGVIAVAIVTLGYIMDDKIKTAEDIRKYTGLVNLAAVPVEESESGKKSKTKARKAGRKA